MSILADLGPVLAAVEALLEHGHHNQKTHGNRYRGGRQVAGINRKTGKPIGAGGSGRARSGSVGDQSRTPASGTGQGRGSQSGPAKEFTSDQEGRAFLDQQYGGWRRGLTAKQQAAMTFYQSPGYELMNGTLRRQPVSARPAAVTRAKQANKDLAAAIAKAPPLPVPVTAWRGFSAQQFGELRPGMTISDRGFVSTAMTRNQAGSFVSRGDQALAKIRLPAGTRAAGGSVKEMVLPPGATFRVGAVTKVGKVTHVELEYVL